MKKSTYLFALALGVSSVTFAQNVGINTDGSDPDTDALLHLLNTNSTALDPLIRLENQQGASVNGIELLNSGGATAAEWNLYIPSTTTDLRISNGTTDRITIQNDGDIGIGTTSPTSTLDINGSIGYKVTTITSADTLNQTHNVVLCNTGSYTVTLPAAADNTGKVYYLKNIDAEGDDITIDGNSSETIDGSTTFVLDPYKHAVRIISDGSNWHVIDEYREKVDNYFSGINCDGSIFTWNDVINVTTGETWMDRNLGAKQVATSFDDADSYGDSYQWGRLKDGHQCRTSNTTATNSSGDVPGDGLFILEDDLPRDWRIPQNDNLWQGVSGINNPCPPGYRLPTQTEWDDERTSWDGSGSASILKLPQAGDKIWNSGAYSGVGTHGRYWSSTTLGTNAVNMFFTNGGSQTAGHFRGGAASVRCIKD